MAETTVRAANEALTEQFEGDAEVQRLLAILTEFGLVPCGTFEIDPPEGPALLARPLADPAGQYYAAVVASGVEGVYLQVTTRFDDDSALTSTSVAQHDDEPEPMGLADSEGAETDPLALISSHHDDVRADLSESGGSVLLVPSDQVSACFADDFSRLLEEAFEAEPELAAAGHINCALAESDPDDELEAEPATRITAYTDIDVSDRGWFDELLAWLAAHGLHATEVNGYELAMLAPNARGSRALWEELTGGDGELVMEGVTPVPWQCVLDCTVYASGILTEEERREVAPFEVSVSFDDPEGTSVNAALLADLAAGLADLCQAIVTYAEPFDYGDRTYPDGLEAGAWLQIHGPRLMTHFGLDRYSSAAPVHAIRTLGEIGTLVQLTAEPTATAELATEGDRWLDHLGGDGSMPPFDLTLRLVELEDDELNVAEWPAEEDDESETELADRRGVERFDLVCSELFVLADPVAAAEALARIHGSTAIDPDNQSLVLGERSCLAYRLDGHAWTVVVANDESDQPALTLDDAKAVSAELSTRAILYGVHNAAESVAYDLIENGELVEQMTYNGGDGGADLNWSWRAGASAPARDALHGTHGIEVPLPGLTFASALREVDPEAVEDPFDFVEEFFRIQDCYEPGWTFEMMLGLATGDAVEAADWDIDPDDVEALRFIA